MGLMLWGCSEPPEPEASAPADQVGAVETYVFEPDPQDYLTAPHPFPLSPHLSPQEALTALGTHLSQSYFTRDPGRGSASIRFEILDVHHFPAHHRMYRLAVINMIDPGQEALQGFFQGSAGGQTTFYMVAATFLQPHLDPPLADGLILLYNGEAFPEFDHVNFRGIVTTERIRPVVERVLHRHRLSSVTVSGICRKRATLLS